MKRMMFSAVMLLVSLAGFGQLRNSDVAKYGNEMSRAQFREVIRIPDWGGMVTLKCDFHIHTVFSDGLVWPTVRVDEAWNEGLDAIAITDHIEYRPHRETVIGDTNASWQMAAKYAEGKGIIVIPGTEITRAKPFGHMNALFVSDVEKMIVDDPEKSVDEALKQGAFIMWNHPGWPDNLSTMYPVHEKMIAAGKIHGVEVFNHFELYPLTLDWCRDMKLTFMGNSDVHNTIANTYTGQRPYTLVFAEERSAEGIKKALFAGHTAAVYNGFLTGRADMLEGLVQACLKVTWTNDQKKKIDILNDSDLEFTLKLGDNVEKIAPGTILRTAMPEGGKATVMNCLTGEEEYLEIVFRP